MENNNRRDFLKTGAMLGTALLATSALGVVATGCSETTSKESSNAPQSLKAGSQAQETTALKYRHLVWVVWE